MKNVEKKPIFSIINISGMGEISGAAKGGQERRLPLHKKLWGQRPHIIFQGGGKNARKRWKQIR